MSTVGYKEAYQRLCRYCKAVDIALVYEYVGNNRWKWVARNYNTGSLHNCSSKGKAQQ